MSKTTVTVMQTEQFALLPKATQALITKLSKDLKVDGLNLFNPLIESMVTIEGFKELKFEAENELCIQQYKDAKAFTRSFNARTKEAKQKLKAPLLATGKDIELIAKTFLASAKDIYEEHLLVEFKPYLDEVEDKKQKALDKKNAATTAKIAELSEQTTDQKVALERSNIYRTYSSSFQEFLNTTIEKVDTYSIEALEQEKVNIKGSSFTLSEEHTNTLLPDQIENLRESYNGIMATSLRLIESKIEEVDMKLKIAKTTEKENAEPIGAGEFIVPSNEEVEESTCPPPAESFKQEFQRHMEALVDTMSNMKTITDKEARAKSSAIAGLGNYMLKIITFLENED